MLAEQLSFMLPLSILLGILAIFFAFLLIRVKLNYYVKFLGIPLLIFGSIFAFKFLDSSFGYAYPAHIPQKFVVLGYEVIESKDEKSIELWLRASQNGSRLYKIPYSKKMEEKLQEGEGQRGNGLLMGEFRQRRDTDADFVDNFKFYSFNLYKVIPKGPASPNTIQQ